MINDEINASTTLYALKPNETKKRSVQIGFFSSLYFQAIAKKRRKKVYPIIPQTGTGTPRNIEYGLCETVSQLIDLEIAQKLL
jgi:hypothetical protein